LVPKKKNHPKTINGVRQPFAYLRATARAPGIRPLPRRTICVKLRRKSNQYVPYSTAASGMMAAKHGREIFFLSSLAFSSSLSRSRRQGLQGLISFSQT
jgi:hypothetical protein